MIQKKRALEQTVNTPGVSKLFLPVCLIIAGLSSLLLVACGDTNSATNLPAATANPTPTVAQTTAAPVSTPAIPDTVAPTLIPALPTSTDTPVSTPTSPPSPTEVPATPTESASPTTLATTRAVVPPAKPAIPTPAPGSNSGMSQANVITASKEKISSLLRPDQREWLMALPDAPGSKLYTYPTCGNVPVLPPGQEDKTTGVCQGNAMGTTSAVNKNGSWEISFSLIWPGTLPPGMKRPQSFHNWVLVVTPAGQVSLTSESGAALPAFPRVL